MSDDRRHNREGEANRPLAELLSTYLDDRESLSSTEIEHVEVLLEQDEAARQSYAELEVITRELSSLPSIESPRSYHLSAEMVGAPEPIALQETPAWYARHAATVRWATAAAAILFAFVLGADLIVNGVFSDPNSDSDLFQMEQADLSSRQDEFDGADDDAGGNEAEILEEEAAGDSGADSEPPSAALAPENADDGEEAEAVEEDESAEEEAVDSEEAEAEAVEEEQSAADATVALEFSIEEEEGETSAATGSDETRLDDSSGEDQAGFVDEGLASPGDGSSDRRNWRIAEFSLVVLLGVLITLMVILPRLGGSSARTGSE